jgi:hypothetical protein
MGPHLALRNTALRAEWLKIFGFAERASWKDFWQKLVRQQAHAWGLDSTLDKFTVNFLQTRWSRHSGGRVTLAELDFAFPPGCSLLAIVQAELVATNKHNLVSQKLSETDGVPEFMKQAFKMLGVSEEHEPTLHNFPEVRDKRAAASKTLQSYVH